MDSRKGTDVLRPLTKLTAICIIFAAIVGTSGFANGDLVRFTTTGQLDLLSGTDSDGFDGATFTLFAEFAGDGLYVDRFGFPSIESVSNSLTIENASVESSNGSFSERFGLVFYPTYPGQFFGGSNGGIDPVFEGTPLFIDGRLVDNITGISLGDQIDVSHLGSSIDDSFPGMVIFRAGSARFGVTNLSTHAVAVPEPGSLFIIGAGVVLCITRRRRN